MPEVQYPDDPISNPSTIRIEDLLATDESSPSPGQVPVREGLPRSFRMRADKHYVEMLDTPAPRPEGRPQPAADAPPASASEPAVVSEDPAAAAQAARDLAQSLAALRACTNLLSDRGPALASAVAANLIRAEAWRATCLLQTSRFLRGEIVPAPKSVPTHTLVEQVLKAIEPERRLRGVTVDEQVSVGESRIRVDEELTVGALSGLVLATIALQDEQAPLTVTLAVESHTTEVVFKVAQSQMRAPSSWATDALPLASAARLVAASGGRMAVVSTGGGTDVRISLPKDR